jgi:hypothetical protein
MKKLILAVLLISSIGALSSFTLKNDTAATKHDTVSDRKDVATADGRKDLATADAKHTTAKHTSDRKDLATAD